VTCLMPIKNGISALHTSTSEMRLFIIERKICEEKHQRKKKKKKKNLHYSKFFIFRHE